MAKSPPPIDYVPQAVSDPPNRSTVERELRRIANMLINLRDRIEVLESKVP